MKQFIVTMTMVAVLGTALAAYAADAPKPTTVPKPKPAITMTKKHVATKTMAPKPAVPKSMKIAVKKTGKKHGKVVKVTRGSKPIVKTMAKTPSKATGPKSPAPLKKK